MAAWERQRLTRLGDTVAVPARRDAMRSVSPADGMAAKILGMQQILGNQAVQQMASTCPAFPSACPTGGTCHTCPARAQTKLTTGQPGDVYEREADHVAERVVESMPFPGLQHKYASGGQRYPLSTGGRGEGEGSVPPIVYEVLRSPGQMLDPTRRTFMESRFGHDFSRVRVHTDARAAESVLSVNALAYTVGRDVVFAAGEYAPETTEGQRILAHELTHVVQQNAGRAIHSRGFHPTQMPLLQRALIPRESFQTLFRPPSTPAPAPSPPAPAPQAQFVVPASIQAAVEAAFRTVAHNPGNFESDFIDILLTPEYDSRRATLNFLIRRFPAVYRLLDTDLRVAIRSQFPDPDTQEEVFNGVISNIANMLFLDLARQWDQRSPRFHRRLEQERHRRERRPPLIIPPGAEVV